MALDEPKKDDTLVKVGAHTFVVGPRDADFIADPGVRVEFIDNYRGKGFYVCSARRRGYGGC